MRVRDVSLFLLLVVVASGCSSVRPSCRPTTRAHFAGEGTQFDLETLEFDDFGVDCSATQLGRVLQKIRSHNAAAPKSGALTVVFVHGWHHGAVSGNLTQFVDGFLKDLADNEWKRNRQHPRKILGVYVAWRGARWNDKPDFLPASYYDRDAAAKRIAAGDVLQDLVAIMTAANQGTYSRSIFFGHSMGGLILERAFTSAMRSYIASAFQSDAKHEWNPPADLVVTLNPAASAMEAWRFKRLLTDWKIHLPVRDTLYTQGARPWFPLLVTVVSEGDWATSSVMHAAATLGSRDADFGVTNDAGRPLSDAQEKRLLRFSPGFTCDLLTHIVLRECADDQGLVPRPCADDYLKRAEVGSLGWTVRFGAAACTRPAVHEPGDPRACAEVSGDRFRLLEINRSGDVPLQWIMRVPNDVIVGHSTFFTAHSRNLFSGLVAITEAMAISPEEPEIPRDAYAMTAAGEAEWRAADELRTSMFGMQRKVVVSGGPPGVCELPSDVSFRVDGACQGASDDEIACGGGGEMTFTAQPEALARSACATIEWQIGDTKSTGPAVTHRLSEPVQVVMTIRSDREPVTARAHLAPAGTIEQPAQPGPPSVSYRGEKSGCMPKGPTCLAGEAVTFSAMAEASDPPVEWEFGGGTVYGTPVIHRFALGGRQSIAATVRNRSGSAATRIDVDVTDCDRPPAPVAILYRGRKSRCTESEGDCVAGELVTYNIDAPPDDCASVEWRFSNGDVVTQREVEHPLGTREQARVTVTTPGGVSIATTTLAGPAQQPVIVTTPLPCASCCTFAQRRETTHTVMPGDWLSTIALAQYHTLDWSRIYDRNRGILRHPDRIRPGQILRIPVCDQ